MMNFALEKLEVKTPSSKSLAFKAGRKTQNGLGRRDPETAFIESKEPRTDIEITTIAPDRASGPGFVKKDGGEKAGLSKLRRYPVISRGGVC